jgi:plastocyanin
MLRSSFAVLALGAVAACGGDDTNNTTADAASSVDSSTATVVEVGCPATPDATVVTINTEDRYDPSTVTIPVNGIVRFQMSGLHNVAPNPIGNTDPGLTVDFGETKCLRFTAAGTFGFYCTPHGFNGTITVQ